MGFFKKDGRGRPDFHELHSLFQLFLEFQEISRPSTKAFQHAGHSANSRHAGQGHLQGSSCGLQALASISSRGFRVRKAERKKTSPQIAIKKELNSVPLVSGLYSQALPLLTLLLHHRYRTFSYSGFSISTRKLPQKQGWTGSQKPPAHTHLCLYRC